MDVVSLNELAVCFVLNLSVVGEKAVVDGNLDSIANELEVDNCSKSVEV